MIDVSHLNERGFWDVAALTDAPLVASHSNAYALCASTRNLTDPQLDAIAASDGMVGLNFAVNFLREDATRDANTPLDVMVRHIDYLVERVGVDGVGFGSDFDGVSIPAGDRRCGGPATADVGARGPRLRRHGAPKAGLRELGPCPAQDVGRVEGNSSKVWLQHVYAVSGKGSDYSGGSKNKEDHARRKDFDLARGGPSSDPGCHGEGR